MYLMYEYLKLRYLIKLYNILYSIIEEIIINFIINLITLINIYIYIFKFIDTNFLNYQIKS